MELTVSHPRATVDLDVAIPPQRLHELGGPGLDALYLCLQRAVDLDLEDYFRFQVKPARRPLQGPLYGGYTFPVEARIGERLFDRFSVDVSCGETILRPVRCLQPENWLEFAGIAAPTLYAMSCEQQFAEKLHAYTTPRSDMPTRVKDLVDMALLLQGGHLDQGRLRVAIDHTFAARHTHLCPHQLASPPAAWRAPFAAMCRQCGFDVELSAAFECVEKCYLELFK